MLRHLSRAGRSLATSPAQSIAVRQTLVRIDLSNVLLTSRSRSRVRTASGEVLSETNENERVTASEQPPGNHSGERRPMEILWLGDVACHDQTQTGGKAAQLSRLAALHSVPLGFCLPATTLAAVFGHHPARQQSETAGWLTRLSEAYAALAARSGSTTPAVAVRSSAIDEDGLDSSFAGQHQTFLNVVGVAAIATAIEQCWLSAHSAQALAYRHQHGLATDSIQQAVLIQLMAPADSSAVMFSANPITGQRDEIVITANWGLGESIVGGTATPDTFTVDKSCLTLRQQQIGAKRSMTIAGVDGTRQVTVPRLLQSQPALTEAQVVEMASLGRTLEQQMGWPVDVECAYVGNHLVLLQCRPITTLASAGKHS